MPDQNHLEVKSFAFKVDSVDDSGEFSGYAAVHSTADQGGDVIKRGAFSRTLDAWRSSGRPIPVLYQHDGSNIVGTTLEAREDDRGLFVRGRLLVDDLPEAKKARALLKVGVLSGMSIGYRAVRESYDQDGYRYLEEIKLYEYSLVTWPMHEEARVMSIKANTEPRLQKLEADVARLRALVEAPPTAPAETRTADPLPEHSADTKGTGPDPGVDVAPGESLSEDARHFLAEIRDLIRQV